jgi:hypothetical protein
MIYDFENTKFKKNKLNNDKFNNLKFIHFPITAELKSANYAQLKEILKSYNKIYKFSALLHKLQETYVFP